MIESLTEEQTAKFPEYVSKWISIGLSTDRCDRDKAKEAAILAYRAANITPADTYVWTDSPMQQINAYIITRLELHPDLSLLNDLSSEERVAAYNEILKLIPEGTDIKSLKEEAVNGSIYGSQDAGWLSFYDYMRNELNLVDETQKLVGLTELSLNCGWWIPAEEICFLSEKPTMINRDPQGRLHSTERAAIQYADGCSLYSVHGVRMPEYIITTPELITVEKIEAETNVEIRRIMIDQYDRYDKGRYITDSGAVLIHKDEKGELYRKEIPDDEPLVMVKVINSTAEPDGTFKTYFLRVPPTCTTAWDAVAWTFEETKETYNPIIET